MVFLQHYLNLRWGWSGVDLFFVLSGFLITGILFDSRNDSHRARNFYIRRTLRIFPLYYGVMFVLLVSFPLFHWDWSWHWLVWPLYAGNFARFVHPYLPGSPLQRLADFQPFGAFGKLQAMPFLGHFWSLCVEEQFYLFWPWIVFAIRSRKGLMAICASTVPVCLAMRLVANHVLPAWQLEGEILFRATPFRVDALLLGGLLALWLRGPLASALLRFARLTLPIALGALLVWAWFSPAGHVLARDYQYPTWKFTWGLSAIDLLAALLILVAIQPGSLVFRLLSLRPLRWLGRISYGAYVLHDIPHLVYLQIGYAFAPVHGVIVAAAIGLTATIILAWLSFRFFESPILELKERWTIRARAAGVAN